MVSGIVLGAESLRRLVPQRTTTEFRLSLQGFFADLGPNWIDKADTTRPRACVEALARARESHCHCRMILLPLLWDNVKCT